MASQVVSRELVLTRRAHAPYEVTVERGSPDPAWDAFLHRTPGSHHVQSTAWAQVKRIAGWRSARVVARQNGQIRGGCQVLLRDVPYAGSFGYAPRGPVVQHGGAGLVQAVFQGLGELALSERLLVLKLQPPAERRNVEALFHAEGWVQSRLDVAPTATLRVDVQRPAEQILLEMRPRVRTYIRQAERKGVRTRVGRYEDLPVFTSLVQSTSIRQGFSPYPLQYYEQLWRAYVPGDHVRLLLVEHEDSLLAGVLLIGFSNTAVYAMGGWSGNRSDVHPNEFAHWAGMMWARDHGHRYYDFGGINPHVARALLAGETRVAPVDGVTRFKLGFGGRVVVFPPAYDRAYRRVLDWPVRKLSPRLLPRSLSHRLAGRRPA
jgi:peptidoglycan pentaglycine glycine transferase (the first glycine)